MALGQAQRLAQQRQPGLVVKEAPQVGQLAGQQHALGEAQGVDGLGLEARVVHHALRTAPRGNDHPRGAVVAQQRRHEIAPQRVAPRVAGGQQRLQVVQHQQQRVLAQQGAQPGQGKGPEALGIVQGRGQPQAGGVELALDLKEDVEQLGRDVAARLGGAVPDIAPEAALGVAVGQLQGAGRLARPGHAVQEHAPYRAARGQRLAGAQHGLQAAHKALRLGREGDAQADGGQDKTPGRPLRRRQVQAGRLPAHQDGRGRRQGRWVPAGRQGLVQGHLQGRGQGLAPVQQLVVQRQHQVGGKAVAHRVAHRQRGAVQPLRQGLGQARQEGGRGGLHRLPLGALLAPGVLVQAHLGPGRGVAAGAAVAGVQDQQLEPRPRRVQQRAQLLAADRVAAALLVLQQQLASPAVARQVDDVPALGLQQGVAQDLARRAVMQHPQLDGQAPRLVQLAHQALQAVALAAQVEGVGPHRQAEGGQDAQALPHRVFGGGPARSRPGRRSVCPPPESWCHRRNRPAPGGAAADRGPRRAATPAPPRPVGSGSATGPAAGRQRPARRSRRPGWPVVPQAVEMGWW